MDIIGFIGVYDKTDLLLNIAKILTKMQKKVLIVDTTLEQKTKYVVPAINPTASYITNFEDFDVAIGFDSLEQIKKYFGIQEGLQYDIILVNADSVEAIESFDLINSKKNFFVTGFDLYSLKRGLEIFSEIEQPIVMTKILFSTDMQSSENEYLNYLASNYKITWNELEIVMSVEIENMTAFMENQKAQKIRFSNLSTQYKECLIFIVQEMLQQSSDSAIRKIVKMIERGA